MATASLLPGSSFAQQGNLAIVIDDIGNNLADFQALELPVEVSFSVLPFTPQAYEISLQAYKQHRDVLLHVPMEANSGKRLGPGALTEDMTEQELKYKLEQSIESLPFVMGVNNHMGSRLTRLDAPMRWTMEVLQRHDLFFLDSRTTRHTIAEKTAEQFGIPTLRRHVFLDNLRTPAALEKQFNWALSLAQPGQSIVMIAHPYPETLAFLSERLKQPLPAARLVAISDILPGQYQLLTKREKEQKARSN